MKRTKWLTGAPLIAFTVAADPAYAAQSAFAEVTAHEQNPDQQDAQEVGLNVIVVTA